MFSFTTIPNFLAELCLCGTVIFCGAVGGVSDPCDQVLELCDTKSRTKHSPLTHCLLPAQSLTQFTQVKKCYLPHESVTCLVGPHSKTFQSKKSIVYR